MNDKRMYFLWQRPSSLPNDLTFGVIRSRRSGTRLFSLCFSLLTPFLPPWGGEWDCCLFRSLSLSSFLSSFLPTVASHLVRAKTRRLSYGQKPAVDRAPSAQPFGFLEKNEKKASFVSPRSQIGACTGGLHTWSSEASALCSRLHDMIDTLSWFLSHVRHRI